jgi:hypothetical protein
MSNRILNFGASVSRALIAILFILCFLDAYAQIQQTNLTGKWDGDNGETYYIEQNGDAISWYGGISSSAHPRSNEATGNIIGNIIKLYWSNASNYYGENVSSGILVLAIISPNKLEVINKTGDFIGLVSARGTLSVLGRSTRFRDSDAQQFALPGIVFSKCINKSNGTLSKYIKESRTF